jgi:hypothetical protein
MSWVGNQIIAYPQRGHPSSCGKTECTEDQAIQSLLARLLLFPILILLF